MVLTIGQLKKEFERVHGMPAVCQIMLLPDSNENDDDNDEAAMVGLASTMTLLEAGVHEGVELTLQRRDWALRFMHGSGKRELNYAMSESTVPAEEGTMVSRVEHVEKIYAEEAAAAQLERAESESSNIGDSRPQVWRNVVSDDLRDEWSVQALRTLEELTGTSTADLCLSTINFEIVAREISEELTGEPRLRWDPQAVLALQVCAEARLKRFLQGACSVHGALLEPPVSDDADAIAAYEDSVGGSEDCLYAKDIILAVQLSNSLCEYL
jgi:hypothetical protein